MTGKMLDTTQRVMIWIGILPPEKSATTEMKIAYGACTWIIFLSVFSGFIAFSAYVVKFWSTDFVGCLHAIMCNVGGTCTIYTMVIIFFSREQMASIFKHLSDIYKAGM